MARKKYKKEHKGEHHIIPTSRGGKDDLANMYPYRRWGQEYEEKHAALHIIFANMTPGETINVIARYTRNDGVLDHAFFAKSFSVRERTTDGVTYFTITERKTRQYRGINKKNAWHTLFGNLSAVEAVEWIVKEFIKKEWLNGT